MGHNCLLYYIHRHKGLMTYDYDNLFTTRHDLLVEVSQFVSALNNNLISANENYPIETNVFDSFNAQLIEELSEYKVYDC